MRQGERRREDGEEENAYETEVRVIKEKKTGRGMKRIQRKTIKTE